MRLRLPAVAVLLAACTLAPSAASAGTYPVEACTGSEPLINDAWQPFSSSTTYLETPGSCNGSGITGGSAETSGLAAADVLQLSTNVPAGATAGWRFTAPLGDTISAVSMNRDLYEQSEGWVPEIVEGAGTALPGETCPFNASNGGCEASGPSVHVGLAASSLAIQLVCDPAPVGLSACANGFSEHMARVELSSAVVTVTDQRPPQIISIDGSLFTEGIAQGTISGAVEGADPSGIQFARLYLDGAQVQQQAEPCDFANPMPCPPTSSNQFSLDTTRLSNGSHQIRAAVLDAAGNETSGAEINVTVDNAPATQAGPGSAATTAPPSGGSAPSGGVANARASPELRIRRVKHRGRKLSVSGLAASRLSGRLMVLVALRLGNHRCTIEKTVPVARGRWSAELPLPARAWTTRVTVSYRGGPHWTAQATHVEVHHPRSSRSR